MAPILNAWETGPRGILGLSINDYHVTIIICTCAENQKHVDRSLVPDWSVDPRVHDVYFTATKPTI